MSNLEKYAREHWKYVVKCKDCKHYSGKDGECPMKSVYYINAKYPDLGDRILFDHTTPDGWCYKGEEK